MQNEPRDLGADAPGDPIYGTPNEDIALWEGQQLETETCAVRAQEFILEQFTGREFDETALKEEAKAKGWFEEGTSTSPGGTMPADIGKLLEAHGVGVNQYPNATTEALANELSQGHKVIIAVDGGELARREPSELLPNIVSNGEIEAGGGMDHAVVVSGIDTTDPNNPQVIISDPGTGEAAARYPLNHFVAAWEDSNFFMTATEDPVPPTAPEMVNFPYDKGQIPQVVQTPVAPVDPSAVPPELLDPSAPGPTLDPNLFDPNAPGPTLDPALINPAAPVVQTPPNPANPNAPVAPDPGVPGPTLDPALLDPAAPGPTLDPALLDPNMPGPTLDPRLFDPAAPGPTCDCNLLDPVSPGPTLDPALLDPAAPGPTIDPSRLDPSRPDFELRGLIGESVTGSGIGPPSGGGEAGPDPTTDRGGYDGEHTGG